MACTIFTGTFVFCFCLRTCDKLDKRASLSRVLPSAAVAVKKKIRMNVASATYHTRPHTHTHVRASIHEINKLIYCVFSGSGKGEIAGKEAARKRSMPRKSADINETVQKSHQL